MEEKKHSKDLLRENLQAIAEQNAKMAKSKDTTATEEEITNAVDIIESRIASELTKKTDARKSHDNNKMNIALRRIEELVKIRSGIYDGTYSPTMIEDIITSKIDSIDESINKDNSINSTENKDAINKTDDTADNIHDELSNKLSPDNISKDTIDTDNIYDDNNIKESASLTKNNNITPTDEDTLEKATEDIISDEEAKPIEINPVLSTHKQHKPKHTKKNKHKKEQKNHWNPFLAFVHIIMNMIKEISQITWPSGKVLALMTLKTLMSMIVFGILIAAVDFGASQLIGYLYSLRP